MHHPKWKFFVQVGFSTAIAGFCMGQLLTDKSAQTQAIYLPLLSGILGYWLPSPSSESGVIEAKQITSDGDAYEITSISNRQ